MLPLQKFILQNIFYRLDRFVKKNNTLYPNNFSIVLEPKEFELAQALLNDFLGQIQRSEPIYEEEHSRLKIYIGDADAEVRKKFNLPVGYAINGMRKLLGLKEIPEDKFDDFTKFVVRDDYPSFNCDLKRILKDYNSSAQKINFKPTQFMNSQKSFKAEKEKSAPEVSGYSLRRK